MKYETGTIDKREHVDHVYVISLAV